MKQIMIVCGYTFRDAAKKKAFIISTVIMLVIILILTLIPRLSLLFSNDDTGGVTGGVTDGGTAAAGETSKICYYIDDDKLITGAVQTLSSVFTDAAFIEADSDMIDTYRGEIEADPDIVMIEVTMMNELPFINVVTRDFMSGIPTEQMVGLLSNVYISQTLALQGIDAETIAFARSTLPFAVETAGNMDFSGYVLGIVLTMLIFFAIYYYGYGVSMSIATEKTSRVMETLIVSAKPSRILLGKCIAMGALGLCQFAGTVIFGTLCYNLLIPADFTLGGMPLSLSALTVESALLIFLYFILGYSLYAVMNAVCGASVSKIEDLNSAMMPVMMIAMVSFYLGYFTAVINAGGSLFQKIVMYIPFTSPFIVPFKLLNGDIAAVDLVISIAALIAAIVITTYISIRVYSASVLHYGKRLKLREAYNIKL